MRIRDQNKRFLTLGPVPDKTDWVITDLEAHEGLSQDFKLEVTLLSNQPLAADSLLTKAFTLSIQGNTNRHFNGILVSITKEAYEAARSLYHYRLSLSSWFSLLKHHRNCRVFQNQSVIDVFKSVCQKVTTPQFEFKLKRTYAKRPFLLQFNESSYHFLARILAEEGIFYYFTHDEKNHRMVLTDHLEALSHIDTPYSLDTGKNDAHFTLWRPKRAKSANKVLNQAYDFTQAKTNLSAETLSQTTSRQNFNSYFYSTRYQDPEHGPRFAKQTAHLMNWQSQSIAAKSNILTLSPAKIFLFNDHRHAITGMTHVAHDPHFDPRAEKSAAFDYHNTLTCISAKLPFSPLVPPAPTMQGYYLAKALCNAHEEIDTDQFGRVRVQFIWEQEKYLPEENICYLRSIQPFCGHHSNGLFVPRANEEVLVNFLDNDPNYPLIVGSLYNAKNLPAHSLPKQQSKSAFHSHSLLNEDSQARHQLLLDDTLGKELFMLASQKDLNVETTKAFSHYIKGAEAVQVGANMRTQTLKGKMAIGANSIELVVGSNSVSFNANGATFKGKVHLQAKGVGTTRPIARVGDDHQCPKKDDSPHKGGPILKGAGNVLANNLPIARVGDQLHCRPCKDSIKKGVNSITINGKALATLNDECEHGGVIVAGSGSVTAGEG